MRIGAIATLAFLVTFANVARADDIPPIDISGGRSHNATINGQTITLRAVNVDARIYFDEISRVQVRGMGHRVSGGATTTGTVTVTWVNTGRTAVLHLSALIPNEFFALGPVPVEQKSLSEVKSIYRR